MIPATQKIYLQAMEEGLLKISSKQVWVVSTPTCGPCLGGYIWGFWPKVKDVHPRQTVTLSEGWGTWNQEVYLASPAVAAAKRCDGENFRTGRTWIIGG